MYPETKSEGNIENRGQNKTYCFPKEDIKCFVIHSKNEQIKQTNEQSSVNNSTSEHNFISSIETLQMYDKYIVKESKEPTCFPGIFEILLL